MPKMKAPSGPKTRFKGSVSRKLRGHAAYSSHILEKKSPKRKRGMRKPHEIAKQDAPRVRQLLAGGKKGR